MSVTILPSSQSGVRPARVTFKSLRTNDVFKFYGQIYIKVDQNHAYCLTHRRIQYFNYLDSNFAQLAFVIPLGQLDTLSAT